MKLFKYENYKVVVSPEALAISAFAAIWDRDDTKNKWHAVRELAYIYFMHDPRSDYRYIIDEDERHARIVEQEGMKKGWQPDAVIEKAIAVYKQLTHTTSSLLLDDLRVTVDNIRAQLRSINLDERDKGGKPVWTLSMVTQTLKSIPDIIKAISEAEGQLEKEIEDRTRMRGSVEKKLLEDGIDLWDS